MIMNSLTFRLLEVYQHVVDCGSVTAASNSLSLSQPTVSLQLKKLSTIVGLPLLEHHQGKIRMTEAGEAVYCCAQEVLSSQAKLESHIRALQGVEIGSLKLAVVTTAKYVIPPILSPFCKAHPNIEVRFTIGNRAEIIDRMHQNKDDLYIFTQPPEEATLECMPFLHNNLVVVAPPDYDGPDNCSIHDILDQKFLLRESGSGTRRAIDQFCEKNQFRFSNTMIIQSNEAIRLAVASGMGLSVISEHTVEQNGNDQVKILNIKEFPIATQWQAVTVKNRPISLAAQAFRETLLDYQNNIVK